MQPLKSGPGFVKSGPGLKKWAKIGKNGVKWLLQNPQFPPTSVCQSIRKKIIKNLLH